MEEEPAASGLRNAAQVLALEIRQAVEAMTHLEAVQ
jgi:hypothetical protein